MFYPFPQLWQTADGSRHHQPLKETWQTMSGSSLTVQLLPQRLQLYTVLPFYWVEVQNWYDNSCSKSSEKSIQFFVIFDHAIQTQHIIILWKFPSYWLCSSLLVLGYFHLFKQNDSQNWWKCWWKGMKKPSVSPWTTGSWQVLTSASWISPIGQPNQLCYSNEPKILSSIHRHHYPHFRCNRDVCILQKALSKCRHIFSNHRV